MTGKPKLVGVAIRLENGEIRSLPAPARHHELFQKFPETREAEFRDQGFVDELGRFYRRRPAEYYAREIGQLTKKMIGSILTSEDLW